MASLLWLIALVTYSAQDPVWFFNDIATDQVHNFAGRFGAFLATVSFQLVGYSAYLLPVVVFTIGWHYFWCTTVDSAYTKLVGAGLLLTCVAGLLTLAYSAFDERSALTTAGGAVGTAAAT